MDTGNVWDRFIVGSDDPDSQEVAWRRLVLQHVMVAVPAA
jgi:hypothetical protein